MVAGNSLEATKLGREFREASAGIGLEPDDAATEGPRTKMARVAAKAGNVGQIQRFEALTRRANVLRSCVLSLKCVAAGIRFRACFCAMAGRQRFLQS